MSDNNVPRPTWVPLPLRCGPCEHEWDDWQPHDCPIRTWTAHIRTIRCPRCGAKRKLFMRLDQPALPPVVADPES